jgi:hypothetical protein
MVCRTPEDKRSVPPDAIRPCHPKPVVSKRCDFEISYEWREDCVRLSLSGEFTEESAHALIEDLRKNCQGAKVVLIQGDGLKRMRPSGCEAFRRNIQVLKDFCYRLVFADANASRLAPQWTQPF